MTIAKAILVTVIAILVGELLAMWLLFGLWYDILFLELKSGFINKLLYLIAVLWFIRKALGKDGLKIQTCSNSYYLIALIIGAAYPYIQIGLSMLYGISVDVETWNTGFHPEQLLNLNIVASIFFAPVAEEFIFRRYIQDGLQRNYSPWIAVLITSLLFASIHINFFAPFFDFMDFSMHRAFLAFFGGLLAGILYLKSKSIGPAIVMHFMWNLVANLT